MVKVLVYLRNTFFFKKVVLFAYKNLAIMILLNVIKGKITTNEFVTI